ncbi:hypothetical protein POJ06DRAFT_256819 [Lipomyces tetrasporus]|uniref:GDP-Man:Man(3)GlcNAc(2)-PP-Dol alpha-1,2-mannosyltransferase n=1 Tax=Lipomyces tetrasporus TaxID=54092 RepID=A0AAD7QQY7_9ASCO|nr:uncharacterized protein POJ06DRAFT_256819 [Lipomyces tetrasporus]KAJ8099381.1 hypothetical protein POJ06DRAFT_256819 [Lipomyces tetrasporus]
MKGPSSPNPSPSLAKSRTPMATLLWRTFKPDPRASLSHRVAVYLCLFFIVSTLAVLGVYLSVKIVAAIVGSRLRRKSEGVRHSIFENFKAAEVEPDTSETEGKKNESRPVIVGFFHPYCNAGGGGERVLWGAVHATLKEHKRVVCAIYTGDTDVHKAEIIEKVKTRFEIDLDEDRIFIVYLLKRRLVAASTWPRVTLLGQALGSIPLGYEAISKLVPDVFVDTMGYAFTYPLVSLLLNIPVAAYVHYPMISTDMFSTLSLTTQLPKYIYWRIFALMYAFAGAFADVVVTNGTWTFNHIKSVWWLNHLVGLALDRSKKLEFKILYPPCGTADLQKFDITKPRQPIVLSIAQFRQEKRHEIILGEFAKFVKSDAAPPHTQLVLIGSVRDDRDRKRVYELRLLARELGINDDVHFVLEAKWDDVKNYLRTASVGVNAMWNEHFGIGVVEYTAAGLISVVHESGGPMMDIVVPFEGKPTGLYFSTNPSRETTLAGALAKVFSMSPDEQIEYRARAQQSAARFSVENFDRAWLERLRVLLMLEEFCRVDRISRGLPS